jgi:hypothetical protein
MHPARIDRTMTWTGDVSLSLDSSCGYGSRGERRSSVATEVTLTVAQDGKQGTSHAPDADCPLTDRLRGRFTAPPKY